MSKVLAVRINGSVKDCKDYKGSVTKEDLKDCTRAAWCLAEPGDVKYVLAVLDGKVEEVFEVKEWYKSELGVSGVRDLPDWRKNNPKYIDDVRGHSPARWCFEGEAVADKSKFSDQVDKGVLMSFNSEQNPVKYLDLNI